MPFVGARFCRDINSSTRAVAVFRIDSVDRDNAFLNGVGIRNVSDFLADSQRDSVERQLVLQVGAAAQIDAIGGPGIVRLDLTARIDGLRLYKGELKRITIQ